MTIRSFLTAAVMLSGAAVNVQAQGDVLKGSQISESALIEALAVEGPDAASGPTRGFRPMVQAPGSDGKAPKPAAGRASLLITFTTASSELTGESKASLDVLARALQSDALAGFSFRVEGHSDPRGDATRNLELSQRRAESVAAYLVQAHGILPERLKAIGKGASEPLNTARIDAPENRRVSIVTLR